MPETPQRFTEDYRLAFARYLQDPGETGLQEAYELGRRAIAGELSALDIAGIHHNELSAALAKASLPAEVERIAHNAAAFFIESLSTFEMTKRGFFEAQRLYEQEHNVAQILQRGLLPERLPEIPGVEIETLYRPGGLGLRVGGDFYDVFQTGEDEWAVVVGDVCGKGPKAAALTGLARNTIRVCAIREPSPDAVLTLLNQAIVRYGGGDFCTLIYGLLRKTPSGVELDVGCGGHPPPFVLRSGGELDRVECEGMMVGILSDVSHANWKLSLNSGDSLILYTDGVTEARLGEDFFGEGRLRSILETCTGYDAAKIVATLGDALDHVEDGPHRDDMAILAVRIQ